MEHIQVSNGDPQLTCIWMSLAGASGLGNPIKGEMFTQNTFIFHMEHKWGASPHISFRWRWFAVHDLGRHELYRPLKWNVTSSATGKITAVMITIMMTKMMKIMMTQMMTKMMTTHHRSGQLNAVLFPHLESLAKVDYLDVVFLLQKNIPFMSSTEEGRIMQYWTNTKGIVTKISSHLVAE